MNLKSAADIIAEAQKNISCVDVDTAKALYDGSDNGVILDVRECDAVAKSKLSESINISRGLVEMKMPNTCPDPDTLILVHCGSGGRASLTAATLQYMGYTNVYAIIAPFDEVKKVFG